MDQATLLQNIIELAELILIFIVSMIGAAIHEYIFRSIPWKDQLKNGNLWIATVFSTIFCYSIDPWIISINPRLILLPPLLIGLAGMDLVMRLSTVKGSTGFFEHALGYFNITNKNKDKDGGIGEKDEILHDETDQQKKEREEAERKKREEEERKKKEQEEKPKLLAPPPPPPQEKPKEIETPQDSNDPVLPTALFEKLMNLDQMVNSVMDSICNLVVMYYIDKNPESFLRGYFTVKNNISIMQHTIKGYQLIPISTAIRLSEILKKEIELDQVYSEVAEELKHTNHPAHTESSKEDTPTG